MSRKAQGSEAARLSSYTYNTTMLKTTQQPHVTI